MAHTNNTLWIGDPGKLTQDAILELMKNRKGWKVIGVADDLDELLEGVKKYSPTHLITDPLLYCSKPQVLIQNVLALAPRIHILVYSFMPSASMIRTIFRSGAKGFLSKRSGGKDIQLALDKLGSGGEFLCNKGFKTLSQLDSNLPPEGRGPMGELSKRELEVLELILGEFNNQEISERLCISPRTVEVHKRRMIQKAGVRNMIGLVEYYLRTIGSRN